MAEIIGTVGTFELDIKRFSIPEIIIKDNCPNCGIECNYDLGGIQSLAYPLVNTPIAINMYCGDGCEHEWKVQAILKVNLELVEPK